MHWPFDQPAKAALRLPGQAPANAAIAWAVFDPDWYRRTHGRAADEDADADALLAHYLGSGQAEGCSPNLLFDERWHLAAYPRIAEAVAAGHYQSAFDAYCRRGNIDRSAHWLFDEAYYRQRHPDLTDAVLSQNGLANGYDHYLRHGVAEARSGHPLFDVTTYLANFAAEDAAAIRRAGAFQHYLQRLEDGGPELRTSVYFDPSWYVRRYPEIARAIAAGRWKSALHHYLSNDTPTAFDPLESFSESHYFRNDPALMPAIAAGNFRNGYMHFLRFGIGEQRSPAPFVDLSRHAENAAVRAAIGQGQVSDVFAHFLLCGDGGQRRSGARLQLARDVHARMAEALQPMIGRFGCRFDHSDAAAVSVILPVRDGFASTMATIVSLRAATTQAVELVIVDCGSSDETVAIEDYVPGATLLRLDAAVGWAQAANAGLRLATAPAVLFLSPTVRLVPGSLDRALDRLSGDPALGVVGGLVLEPDGTVRHAGGLLTHMGAAQAGQSALAPEVNVTRAVDFVSSSFLLGRTSVVSELDGFDPDCPAGVEAIDLCLRVAAAGSGVLYDPAIMMVETSEPETPVALDASALQKHSAATASRAGAGAAQAPGYASVRHSPRILFIEDTIPVRRLGSGFVRSNDIVRSMAALGAAVTVFPINGSEQPVARIFADLPDTVEPLYRHDLKQLGSFLTGRPDHYDVIWISRLHNLVQVNPVLADLQRIALGRSRLILDTEALTPYRDAQRAALSGKGFDPLPEMHAMRAQADACSATIGVTPAETAILEELGFPRPFTIGHAIEARPTPRPFSQRAGLLFVGAIHAPDSPNLDSLRWFVAEVLPRIEEALGWETRLTIAGHVAPGIDMDVFRRHPRISLHRSPDLTALYNSHRVFVAPTRYAAGAPYKVLEAASRGLPVTATELLRAQLGWVAEQEVMVGDTGDPAGFAALVVALYCNDTLWRTVRDGALRRLRRDNDRADFTRSIATVLGSLT